MTVLHTYLYRYCIAVLYLRCNNAFNTCIIIISACVNKKKDGLVVYCKPFLFGGQIPDSSPHPMLLHNIAYLRESSLSLSTWRIYMSMNGCYFSFIVITHRWLHCSALFWLRRPNEDSILQGLHWGIDKSCCEAKVLPDSVWFQ